MTRHIATTFWTARKSKILPLRLLSPAAKGISLKIRLRRGLLTCTGLESGFGVYILKFYLRSYLKVVRDSTQPLHQNQPRSEDMHPSSNPSSSFKRSVTEALAHTSTIPATSVQLSDPPFLVGSKPISGTIVFNSAGQRHTDLYDSTSEMVAVSSDPPSSQGEIRDQQLSEGSPLLPSEQQFANHRRHPSPDSVPSFVWPVLPSLGHPPTDSTRASQIIVSPGTPVDIRVFDWRSTPNPLAETSISMST